MKKIIFIVILNLVLFSNVFSQDIEPPCKPDCENSEWQPAYPDQGLILNITICDILFEVRYRYRYACNTWYDYYIEVIGLSDESQNTDVYNCILQVGGLNNFLRLASEQLIIQNPANFPPTVEGDCATNWRVLKGSCWRRDFITGIGGIVQSNLNYSYWYYLGPCTPIDCCLEYYTVCIENGVKVITQTGYLPPEVESCNDEAGCVPVCGSIYNR